MRTPSSRSVLEPPPSRLIAFTTPWRTRRSANSIRLALRLGQQIEIEYVNLKCLYSKYQHYTIVVWLRKVSFDLHVHVLYIFKHFFFDVLSHHRMPTHHRLTYRHIYIYTYIHLCKTSSPILTDFCETKQNPAKILPLVHNSKSTID